MRNRLHGLIALCCFFFFSSLASHANAFFRSLSDRLLDGGDCLYVDRYQVEVSNGRVVYGRSMAVIAQLTKISRDQVEWRRFNQDEPNLQPIVIDVVEVDSKIVALMRGSKGTILVCGKG